MTDHSELSDEEKVEKIYEAIHGDDEIRDKLTDWEYKFINNMSERWSRTNFEPSFKESRSIDEIYEKLWKKDLLE